MQTQSGMLENINTKQTSQFYSKDAKLNSQIHEQIQLRSFHIFLHSKKKKKMPRMGSQEKNK